MATALALALAILVGCEKKDVRTDSTQPPERSMEELAPPTPPVTTEPVEPVPPAPEERTYTIKPGDTYIKLARRLYNDESRFKEIEKLNPGLDPKKLRPGTVIKLPAE